MLTLLKKYKMWILAIFGIFIMISFLLADTLQRNATAISQSQRVFTMDGEKVTNGHAAVATMAVESLRRSIPGSELQQLRIPDENRVENWIMRTHEAKRAGLNAGPVDGRMYADEIGQRILQMAAQRAMTQEDQVRGLTWQEKLKNLEGLTDEQLDTLVRSQGSGLIDKASSIREPKIDGADVYADVRAMKRMNDEVTRVAVTSGPRVHRLAQLLDQAFVSYVVVSVDEKQIAAQPEPTEADLQEHFARFKDVPLDTGDFAMGLKQPDRVALSRLTIDRSAVAAVVTIDPVDVQKKLATQPALAGTDAGSHRRNIEEQLKSELTDQIVRETAAAVRAEIVRVVAALPESAGFRELPQGWEGSRVDLRALAAQAGPRMAAKFGFPLPPPVVVDSPLSSQRLMARDGVLGVAIAKRGQQTLTASDVVFSAKEFKRERALIPAQVGLPVAESFEDGSKNVHFVMITQAAPAASPANVEEVRARIAKDVRSIRAVGAITKALEEAKGLALLTNVADAGRVLREKGFSVGEQARANVSEARGFNPPDALVNTPEVVSAAMSAARKLDPTLRIDPLTAGDRTFVIAPKGKLAAVLGQVIEFRPVTQDDVRMAAGMLAVRLREMESAGLLDGEFSNAALLKRLRVEDLNLKAGE